MGDTQKSTNDDNGLGMAVIPRPYSQLTEVQRAYVDYKAVGGIITDEEGHISNLSVQGLADMLGVTRFALYKGKEAVPNFWELVNQRRREIGLESRLSKIHQVWYIKAAAMNNWPVTEAWLRNFDPAYREPRTKIEHELGSGLADLIQTKRKNQVPERKVIDASNSNT